MANKVWKYGKESLRRVIWEENMGKDGVARNLEGRGDSAAEEKKERARG